MSCRWYLASQNLESGETFDLEGILSFEGVHFANIHVGSSVYKTERTVQKQSVAAGEEGKELPWPWPNLAVEENLAMEQTGVGEKT